MFKQWMQASGYLVIFIAPLLLVAGIAGETPVLAFVILFLVAPLLRALLGDAAERAPQWAEAVAIVLDWLPGVFGLVYLVSMSWVIWQLHDAAVQFTLPEWIGFGFSLFAVSIFASCPAHELLHNRAPSSRLVGRIVAGVLGYPILEHEHRAHHGVSGDVDRAEWPRQAETVWGFSLRRAARVVESAWEGNVAMAQQRGRRFAGGLGLPVASMLATWIAFLVAAGWVGAVVYGVVAAAIVWSMQALAYVQHWGLGSDSLPDARRRRYGWEDRCRLQVWLTLGIAYHQAHHHSASIAYYRLEPMRGSPRMPAGYVVLLFASMVPPLWRALMLPALEVWKADPTATQPTAGRRLICFHQMPERTADQQDSLGQSRALSRSASSASR